MNRRTFFSSLGAGGAMALARPLPLRADLPKMTITRIRFYHNPRSRPMFNQSFHIVTVETDQGIIGLAKADRAIRWADARALCRPNQSLNPS